MKAPVLFLTAAFALVSAAPALAAEWEIEPTHSAAHFAVKHMMVSTVRGSFEKVSGTVMLDDQDLSKSKVDVSIDPSSINTREAKRDAHLKSPEFFDTAKYPQMTFKSTKVEKGADGKWKVVGDLTMHGVTKPVTLTVDSLSEPTKTPWGTTIRGVSASGKLNRKDWGLTWNKALEAGGVAVGEEVELTLDAELTPKAPGKVTAKK